jgi:hypothetical protein
MQKATVVLFVVAAGLWVSSATVGQEPAGITCSANLFAGLRLPQPAQEINATCTATCGQMGGTASVSCSGSCIAVDQDCESGEQGYAQCLSTGQVQWCNPCVQCSAQTTCPDGTVLQCTGYTGVCQGDPLCYVWCGGYHIFCPGHEGEELCEN